MGKWISKAVSAFKGDQPDAPQPFVVMCECGMRHNGLRRQRSQNLICKDCGTSLFILPRDVYPAPATPLVRDPSRRSHSVSEDAETEDELVIRPLDSEPSKKVFQPNSAVPLPKPKLTKRQIAKQAEQERLAKEAARVESRQVLKPLATALQRTSAETATAFVKFWTPMRLIFGGLALTMAIAGMLMLSQVRTSQSVEIARDKSATGMQAVADQNWTQAEADLQPAARALRHLGRRDADALAILQAAREVHALLNLNDVSLLEFLQIADAELSSGGSKSWQETFAQRFRGKWIVLDAPLVREPSERKREPDRWLVKLPAVQPVGAAVIDVTSPEIARLGNSAPQRVVLAGELHRCERQDGEWVIALDHETCFAWTNPRTLSATGLIHDALHPAADMQALLAAQATVLKEAQP